jgi:hypothetical protein
LFICKLDVLRARLVTQTRGTLKASCITKFAVSFTQLSWRIDAEKEVVANQRFSKWRLDEMWIQATSSFSKSKLAMQETGAPVVTLFMFYLFE